MIIAHNYVHEKDIARTGLRAKTIACKTKDVSKHGITMLRAMSINSDVVHELRRSSLQDVFSTG